MAKSKSKSKPPLITVRYFGSDTPLDIEGAEGVESEEQLAQLVKRLSRHPTPLWDHERDIRDLAQKIRLGRTEDEPRCVNLNAMWRSRQVYIRIDLDRGGWHIGVVSEAPYGVAPIPDAPRHANAYDLGDWPAEYEEARARAESNVGVLDEDGDE